MGIISDMRAEGQRLANADLLKVAVRAIQETGADPIEVLTWMASYEEWRSEFAGYADKPTRPCPEGGEIESWFREHKPQGIDYFKGPENESSRPVGGRARLHRGRLRPQCPGASGAASPS